MILKNLLISLAVMVIITAADPFFGTDLSWRQIPHDEKGDFLERSWVSTDAFNKYLFDDENRVAPLFRITPYYYPSVKFWFLVYTQFESSSVIIHDKTNLSLIYKILDFDPLYRKKSSRRYLHALQQKISQQKLKEFKHKLDELAKDPFSANAFSKEIHHVLKQANLSLPVNKSERSRFFTNLKNNLRTQTGQKDFIREGVIRSLPYHHFITRHFTERKLPKELLAIPFLESSFNPRANSKVNALGVWQFMPLIANYYVPRRTRETDYRSSIGVASVSAGFLMSENFAVMKSWDLAVTAYNSGTKHLLKTKRKLASKNVNLEDVIKNSDSRHFGFASKNFYSEFLALVHTLAYKDDLFFGIHQTDRSDVNQKLRFFLAKCRLRLPSVLNEKQMNDVHFHNHQVKDLQLQIPRGFILNSKNSLPKNNFFELHDSYLIKIKPKDWHKLLSNQSCSTR
jgi:membrane-bound lytic murein transglycosylase D